MRYALPIALWVCLAALIVITPHLEPQRLRLRARHAAEQLRTRDGFREGSRASWSDIRSSGLPPFHYGRRGDLDNVLIGTLDGLSVRLAGYEVLFNGSRHRYGLALVGLPRPVAGMEVRGERPFTGPRVAEPFPDSALKTGTPEFDAVWNLYAESSESLPTMNTAGLAQAMLDAPARFSWRVAGTDLLLWKRDGWSDATQLLETVGCVTDVLGLTDRRRPAAR